MILCQLRLTQLVTLLETRVNGFSMRAHDATPSRNPLVEKTLHYFLLINPVGQPNTVALPI
jgi:hypothetical protein